MHVELVSSSEPSGQLGAPLQTLFKLTQVPSRHRKLPIVHSVRRAQPSSSLLSSQSLSPSHRQLSRMHLPERHRNSSLLHICDAVYRANHWLFLRLLIELLTTIELVGHVITVKVAITSPIGIDALSVGAQELGYATLDSSICWESMKWPTRFSQQREQSTLFFWEQVASLLNWNHVHTNVPIQSSFVCV